MSQNPTLIRQLPRPETEGFAWEGLAPELLKQARERIRKLAWLDPPGHRRAQAGK